MTASAYASVPYPAAPVRDAHPARLLALAALAGLGPPPPVERWRVLEVGCSDGGNLLPLAAALPSARFLGIDLEPGPVEAGRALARRAGLANVALEARDLATLAPEEGPFDVVIAHGVYSWVPPEVQEALLARIGALLAPHGAAFVSMNVEAGWRVRGLARRWLRERTAGDLRARVTAARRLIEADDLPADLPSKERAYLQDVVQDAHLAHDLLAEENEALSLEEFASRCARHGLEYLCDAESAPGEPIETVAARDEERGRAFRRAVIARRTGAGHAPADAGHAPAAHPERSAAEGRAQSKGGHGMAPLYVALLESPRYPAPPRNPILARLSLAWPEALPFPTLASGLYEEEAAARILELVRSRQAEVRAAPLGVATEVPSRPLATALARAQAEAGGAVANLRHALVRLGEEERQIVALLDGTHDVREVAREAGVGEERAREVLAWLVRAALLQRDDAAPASRNSRNPSPIAP